MTVWRGTQRDRVTWLKGQISRLAAPVNIVADLVTYATSDLQKRTHIHHEQLFAGENLVGHYIEVLEKPTAALQNSYDRSSSAAAEFVRTAKASAGRIYGANATNTNVARRYMQLHNTAGAPAGGAVPLCAMHMATTDYTMLQLPIGGIFLNTGITIAISTTLNTYTAAGNDHIITVLFK